MLAFPSADRVGGIDGRDTAFCESLYLLSDRYQILGMRPADRLSGPTPAVGDLFFGQPLLLLHCLQVKWKSEYGCPQEPLLRLP